MQLTLYCGIVLAVFFMVGLSAIAAQPASAPAHGKKLIEFGWDEPDTAFLRKHIREMEKRPFDGVVFDIIVQDPKGPQRFDQVNWGARRFKMKELQPAIDDLKASKSYRLTDNFLRLNVMPGDVDWFDDFG